MECWLRQSYPPCISSQSYQHPSSSITAIWGRVGGRVDRRPKGEDGKQGGKKGSAPLWMKKGENECAMSAPRNQDRMVPHSNAIPSGGGHERGGVPVQTDSPDTSVSG